MSPVRRVAILAALSGVVWVLTAALVGGGRLATPSSLDDRDSGIEESFSEILRIAARVPATALDRTVYDAAPAAGKLADRLLGVALYDALPGRIGDWQGTPDEVPEDLWRHRGPGWIVRRTGRQIRLIVVDGPDPAGRRASATLVLDSGFPGGGLASLLPSRVTQGHDLRFVEPGVRSGADRVVPLRAPDGTIVAHAEVVPRNPAAVGSRGRGLPTAMAACVAVLFGGLLFGPEIRPRTIGGLLSFLAALAAARVAWIIAGVPAALLPAPLGSAEWYGSTTAWGALASPADLFLSGLAVLLAAYAIRTHLLDRNESGTAWRFTTALVGALGATALLAAVATSVALNGRTRLLGVDAVPWTPSSVLLILGLGCFLLAAARLLATAWGLRPFGPGEWERLPRPADALALLPVALAATLAMQAAYDRVAVERLVSEFAPQVLEQGARRRLALAAAVDQAADTLRSRLSAGVRTPDEFENLAYDLWSRGALFQAGYKSSLTLYGADGALRAHFGYDLPALAEPIDPVEYVTRDTVVRSEPFQPIPAVRQRLHHAGRAVTVDGAPAAIVVGHVVDEPDDLPFLPVQRTYLGWLGPGGPTGDGADAGFAPEYILYDPVGEVRFHTLGQPPPWTYAIEKAAIEGGTVRIEAGGEPYFGVPLVETDRLHLLLAPAPTILDRIGTFVRLVLLGAALLVVSELLGSTRRPRGVRGLLRAIRGSYYRKLVVVLLLATVLPWVGLSLVVQGEFTRRSESIESDSATRLALVAKRVVEDFANSQNDGNDGVLPDDNVLFWLRRLVEQDIHLYEGAVLLATSKRELFESGLLVPRLPSDVHFRVDQLKRPVIVRRERLGATDVPVAYAPVRLDDPGRRIVVAVPLVLHRPEVPRAIARTVELLLLSTVFLAGMLALAAAPMARTVARPIRDLGRAAGRIAAGDYATRLRSRSRSGDEITALVHSFNAMAGALEEQRSDLEQRRDYMEALLRNATTGVVSTDADGRIVTMNPAAGRLLESDAGVPRLGMRLADEVSRSATTTPVAERLERPAPPDAPAEIDLVGEAEARRLRVVAVELPDPEGGRPGRLVLLEDVTDLMRRNQLEAWAEMARAIAHEIKNPLTPIQLSVDHLGRLLDDRGVLPSHEIEACLATVAKQVRALRQIAAEFSAYSKMPAPAPVPTDPAKFLAETLEPYRVARPVDVEIVERYAPCPLVPIDRWILARAVVNLVENALQAMPDGGTLTIEAEPDPAHGEVRITVRDTGSGLEPDVRARLFEPYFSTKSSGTGLGLAIVRRAVEEHGGRVDVESEAGRGAAFRLWLPVTPRELP